MSNATKIDKAFPEKLKLRRQHLGISQQKLSDLLSADGVNLSKHAIAQIEVGKRAVKVGEAFMLAQALVTDLEGLISQPSPMSEVDRWARSVSSSRSSAERAGRDLLDEISGFYGVLPIIDDEVMGEDVAIKYKSALNRVQNDTGPIDAAVTALCDWVFRAHGLHEYLPGGAMELAAQDARHGGEHPDEFIVPEDKVYAVLHYFHAKRDEVRQEWWATDLLNLQAAHQPLRLKYWDGTSADPAVVGESDG